MLGGIWRMQQLMAALSISPVQAEMRQDCRLWQCCTHSGIGPAEGEHSGQQMQQAGSVKRLPHWQLPEWLWSCTGFAHRLKTCRRPKRLAQAGIDLQHASSGWVELEPQAPTEHFNPLSAQGHRNFI